MITTPDQLMEAFGEYYRAGDADGLASLFEDDVRVIPSPGQEAIVGREAVKGLLREMVASGTKLTIIDSLAVGSDDLVLNHCRYRMDRPDADSVELVTAEVMRRQPDGSLCYAIDNPWGETVFAAQAEPAS